MSSWQEDVLIVVFSGNQIKQPSKGHDDKNQLSQCKELWLFWYGEKPETLKSLVSVEVKSADTAVTAFVLTGQSGVEGGD